MISRNDILTFRFLTYSPSIFTNLYSKLEDSEAAYSKVPILIEDEQELEESLAFLERISYKLEVEKEVADVLERGYAIVPNRAFRPIIECSLKNTLKLIYADKGVVQSVHNKIKELFIVEELRDNVDITYYISTYASKQLKRHSSTSLGIINVKICWRDTLSNVPDEVVVKQLMLLNNNGIGAGSSSSVLIKDDTSTYMEFQFKGTIDPCFIRLGLTD